ncbi:hypothetical protein [Geminicoccus harenae]|uniref:hypothetical protein n=1 Tax=Geminicoccus harenae TaxID=2498453 RepID=UPI00168BD049|nr:hypothetical protein [Geminicoccus harenae]
MAFSAELVLWVGVGQLLASIIAAILVLRSLSHSREAVELSRNAFVADNRPWLSVKIELIGPLRWEADGLTLPVRFFIRNLGRTPALRAGIAPLFCCMTGTTEPVKRHAEFCDGFRSGMGDIGTTIFPEDEYIVDWTVLMTNEDSEQSRSYFKKFYNVDRISISPCLMGCVFYTSFQKNEFYQTGFMYDIQSRPRNGTAEISRDHGDVPMDYLMLRRHFQDARTF